MSLIDLTVVFLHVFFLLAGGVMTIALFVWLFDILENTEHVSNAKATSLLLAAIGSFAICITMVVAMFSRYG